MLLVVFWIFSGGLSSKQGDAPTKAPGEQVVIPAAPRDLSLVVPESTRYEAVESLVRGVQPQSLEEVQPKSRDVFVRRQRLYSTWRRPAATICTSHWPARGHTAR